MKERKIRVFDVVALALVIAGAAVVMAHRSAALAGQTAPAMTLATTAGSVHIGGPQDHVVVLDFWASWCPPCKASVPLVSATSDEFSGVALVDVDEGDPVPIALRYGRAFRAGPIAFDTNLHIGAAFGASSGLPLLVIINRQGRIVREWRGFDPNIHADLSAALRSVGVVSRTALQRSVRHKRYL